MSHFLTGVCNAIVEECLSPKLHDNMNVSCLMFHAQQVEESRLRSNNREDKRGKSDDCGSSKGRLEIQDKPRFKKRFSNKDP